MNAPAIQRGQFGTAISTTAVAMLVAALSFSALHAEEEPDTEIKPSVKPARVTEKEKDEETKSGPGQPAPAESGFRSGLLFAGTFEKAEVVSELEGAKRTQLAAAREWSYGVRFYTREEWGKRGWTRKNFYAAAREVADAVAEEMSVRFIRDHRGVIDYALVAGEDPFLGSALLSAKFLERFADTLGEELLVIPLDRQRLYVFPGTGGKMEEYGPALVEQFRTAKLPVSLEVLRVDKTGLRVVGELER